MDSTASVVVEIDDEIFVIDLHDLSLLVATGRIDPAVAEEIMEFLRDSLVA